MNRKAGKKKNNLPEGLEDISEELVPHGIKEVFVKSVKQSLEVSWMLIKIYIPLSLLTTFLKQFGFLDYIAPFFSPLMKFMGLPGEASVVLIAGFANNIFAALATMSALDLSFRQITILGVIIGLSHNLFVETGILTKLKVANFRIAFFRIIVAIITGILMNIFIPENIHGTVINPYYNTPDFSWPIFLQGLVFTSLQIIIVLFLITLIYESFMLWKYSSVIKEKLKFIPNSIGFSDNAFGAWIVGFFIGIAYGAGILFQFAKQHRLSHKDSCLITIFLCLAHAIIEDTMLFAVVGGNFFWIIAIRVLMAFLIVKVLSIKDLYKKILWIGLPRENE